MQKQTLSFYKYLQQGKIPISYALVETNLGWRAFGKKELKEGYTISIYIADGTWIADGTVFAGIGGLEVLEKPGKIIAIGSLTRTLKPQIASLLAMFTSKQLQHITISLDNTDNYFSKLISTEALLSYRLYIYLGFEDLPFITHIKIFSGKSSEVEITDKLIKIKAIEA